MTNPRYGNSEASSQFNNLQNLIDTVKNEISHNELYIKRYELDFRRFEQLKEVGGVALRDFEEIDNELKVLRATGRNKKEQLAHLEQRFQEVERQLELQKFCEVTAPCRGVVWSILVKDGEHVNMGEEVVQLVNCETVWVDAFFNERYAGKLRPGMKVKVKPVGSNENWDGEIVFIRGGSGRIMYGAAVEVPPTVLSRRLVAVRVKVDWKGKGFRESEFYGIGRSLIVSYRKEPRFFSWIK
jgi:multidrug resistance efflux pump